jgi:hypothetical protein
MDDFLKLKNSFKALSIAVMSSDENLPNHLIANSCDT